MHSNFLIFTNCVGVVIIMSTIDVQEDEGPIHLILLFVLVVVVPSSKVDRITFNI